MTRAVFAGLVGKSESWVKAIEKGRLPGDIPPPRAPLHREHDVVTAGEPRQPAAQVHPAGRRDLAALYPPVAVSR